MSDRITEAVPFDVVSTAGNAAPTLRIAFYSHDTLGLGHIRRNLLLAEAIATSPLDATTLLITGAREAAMFPMPARVDSLTLPSIQKDGDGQYRARRMSLALRDIISLRARIIQGALEALRPDVLVVDTEPRGAFRELDPSLSWLRMQGHAHCVLGMRDVRDEPAAVKREWQRASNDAAIRDYYDQVWVYGDPLVVDVVRDYGLSTEVAAKLRYTGYLDQRARLQSVRPGDDAPRLLATLPPGRLMLCTVGGGQDGASLARAFIDADLPRDAFGLVLAGPQMAADTLDELRERASRRKAVRVLRFVPEPGPLLERADRLVTMGGYNSTLEAVSFGKPALIVPRVLPRKEQWIRAERLNALGLVDVLHPDQLSPRRIGDWLAADYRPQPSRAAISMDGLDQVVRFVATRRRAVIETAAAS